jgi:hypothetical protein
MEKFIKIAHLNINICLQASTFVNGCRKKKSNYVYICSYSFVSFPGFYLYDKVKECKEADLITKNEGLTMRMIRGEELCSYTYDQNKSLRLKILTGVKASIYLQLHPNLAGF